jgi:hypothetical protein
MNGIKQAIFGLGALALVGCGSHPIMNGAQDLAPSHPVDDGHVQTGCFMDSDCDDGMKCHTFSCNLNTHMCNYQDKSCQGGDPCNNSACDPGSGQCVNTAANDGAPCTASTGDPGTCAAGNCTPTPNCYGVNQFLTIYCDSGSLRYDDNTNDPSVSFDTTNVLSTYACATNESASEVAYQFSAPTTGPVTVRLKVTPDPASPDMAGTPDADLDLIILDGSCTAAAACANPTLPGGGYQGITAGTGTETVTFNANSGTTYYIVVDGKNGATANYHLEIESCGVCSPTPSTRIGCGMSIPSGDTTKGMSALSSYMCTSGATTQNLSLPGNEQAFEFATVAPVSENVTATVTGASGPVTLLALPVDFNGQCDATSCVGSQASTAGSASLTFSATPSDSITPAYYWLVVDTSTAGANATFGLSLDCAPYCSQNDNLDCTTKTSSNNNSAGISAVSNWGPGGAPCNGAVNLSGPEYVYLFSKPATTGIPTYRFTLASITSGKHLGLVILDAGATLPTTCDPSLACASATPQTVAATATTLASTGTIVAAGPGTTDGGTMGETAVVDLASSGLAAHYYWVVVDGVGGDVGDFALSIDSGCN